MPQEAAQRALSERGLSLGSVDQVESDKPEGTVVWQSIDANSSVNQGTTVNIQISKGKKADEQKPDSSTTGGNTGSSEDDRVLLAGQTSAHTGVWQRDHSGGAARQRGYRPCRDLCRWRHSV